MGKKFAPSKRPSGDIAGPLAASPWSSVCGPQPSASLPQFGLAPSCGAGSGRRRAIHRSRSGSSSREPQATAGPSPAGSPSDLAPALEGPSVENRPALGGQHRDAGHRAQRARRLHRWSSRARAPLALNPHLYTPRGMTRLVDLRVDHATERGAVLAVKSGMVPVQSVAELIAFARKIPGGWAVTEPWQRHAAASGQRALRPGKLAGGARPVRWRACGDARPLSRAA